MATNIDTLIRTVTNDFVEGMEKSGEFARRNIIGLVRELDVNEDGTLIATDRNSSLIQGVSIGIQQVTASFAFENRVDKVVNSIPDIRKAVERNFIVQHGIIKGETIPILNNLQTRVENDMEQILSAQTIENEIHQPVSDITQQLILGNFSQEKAIDFVNEKVPNLFTQFAHVRVDTTLQQYSRSITQILAEQEGLIWFKYSGPTGPTSLGNHIRDFCDDHVDQVWLKAEIEQWPQQNWDGKIPSTNSFTIFQNLGGYNCRHDLTPVAAKDVPQSSIDRAKRNGLL